MNWAQSFISSPGTFLEKVPYEPRGEEWVGAGQTEETAPAEPLRQEEAVRVARLGRHVLPECKGEERRAGEVPAGERGQPCPA